MVVCAQCSAENARLMCKQCCVAHYCSAKCQAAHWVVGGHGLVCVPVAVVHGVHPRGGTYALIMSPKHKLKLFILLLNFVSSTQNYARWKYLVYDAVLRRAYTNRTIDAEWAPARRAPATHAPHIAFVAHDGAIVAAATFRWAQRTCTIEHAIVADAAPHPHRWIRALSDAIERETLRSGVLCTRIVVSSIVTFDSCAVRETQRLESWVVSGYTKCRGTRSLVKRRVEWRQSCVMCRQPPDWQYACMQCKAVAYCSRACAQHHAAVHAEQCALLYTETLREIGQRDVARTLPVDIPLRRQLSVANSV